MHTMFDKKFPCRSGQKEYCIIHDSEDDGGKESLECQLERALERGLPLIIVEPTGLGDETIRYHFPITDCACVRK